MWEGGWEVCGEEWMREGGGVDKGGWGSGRGRVGEWMRKEEVFYVGWEGEVGSGKG